jgi:DNA methyltransferase 1-associated protein 1
VNTKTTLEYPFARYNAKSADYRYSQDEYTKFLEGGRLNCSSVACAHILLADPGWSKEETDYLFDLIREYNFQFYIVADRYEFPGGPLRSMEVRYPRSRPFTYLVLALGLEG